MRSTASADVQVGWKNGWALEHAPSLEKLGESLFALLSDSSPRMGSPTFFCALGESAKKVLDVGVAAERDFNPQEFDRDGYYIGHEPQL
jgi:hypothetical protein